MGDYVWTEFLINPATVPGSIKPLAGVGTRYDVAINQVGLNLFAGGDQQRDLNARRVMLPLEPERFASGDTPFSDAIQRYTFTGWSDLSGGAGQVMRDRPSSDGTRYWHSQGINPFVTPGEISLLPETAKRATATGKLLLYQAGADLYLIDTTADTVKVWTDPEGTPSTVTAPGGILDATSDGHQIYLATTAGIYRGTAAGFTSWSAKVVGRIDWVYQRIVVAMPYAGATTNNSYWSLGPDGLFDTPGAAPGDDADALPWLVLPSEWEIHDSVGGGGQVWFPAAAPSKSTVFGWKPDSNNTPTPAWELPANELATAVIHYQGQVLVRASVVDESLDDPEPGQQDISVAARLYRCVIDQNNALVPFLLVGIIEDDENNGAGGFYALGRFVWFGWSAMADDNNHSGVGVVDLATSGWCRSMITPPSDGVVRGTVGAIREWQGKLWFGVDGHGVWATTPNRVPYGYLATDAVDKASTLMKFISTVRAVFDPLPAGSKVQIEVSYDRGQTWVDYEWIQAAAGAQELVTQLNQSTRTISLRVWLYRGTDPEDGPVVTITQMQMHQASLVDEMIEWPVDCSDVTFAPSGARSDEGAGTGFRRARWLESLAQAEVAVQDVDYPYTEEVGIFQVVGTEVRFVVRYNEAHGRNEPGQVCLVSLRRPQHRLA